MSALLAVMLALATGKSYAIQGAVHSKDRAPVENAIVVLQCTCIDATRETVTDARGRYRFGALPPGTYTIQVLRGHADVSKVVTLPP